MTQQRKRGGLSVIRIGLIAGAVGLAMVLIGVVIFLNDQSARRGPFDVALYPGAQLWGTSDQTSTSRTVLYRVADADPQAVADFYQERLNAHNGDDSESCVRIPPTGEYPLDPTNPLSIPYQFTCMFSNSGFNTTQYTQVVIYPGMPSDDPDLNSAGMTVIEYQQRWSA